MNKKVVVLGGGTGQSTLLRGLKEFPVDITTIVSMCDDGRSTGRLRKEFHVPAVGDIRKVIVSLSSTEPIFEKVMNYRFETTSDLNGHTVGNLLLTAMTNITGSMSDAIESLSTILNLKGKVLSLTEDQVVLMAKMKDGSIIEGQSQITHSTKPILDVYYKEKPTVPKEVITSIEESDLIVLSMGSLFTSIIPNLICEEVLEALEHSMAPILYVCNMMTQPGETNEYKVSDHIRLLNEHLGNRKVDVVIVNNGIVSEELIKNYASLEQKAPVIYDKENVDAMDVEVILDNFVAVTDGVLRHNVIKLASHIFSYLLD